MALPVDSELPSSFASQEKRPPDILLNGLESEPKSADSKVTSPNTLQAVQGPTSHHTDRLIGWERGGE